MKRLICALLSILVVLSMFTACGRNPLNRPDGEQAGIGEFVDDSQAKYFFKDGPRDKFTPRNDYGWLINYYTNVRYNRYPHTDWETNEDTYTYRYAVEQNGLATRDGRIVSIEDRECYYSEFRPGKGIIINRAKDNGSVMSAEGKWSIPADNALSFFGYGLPYFMVKKDDTLFIYDINGRKRVDLSSYLERYGDDCFMPSINSVTKDYIVLKGLEKADGSGIEWGDGVTVVNMKGKTVNSVTFSSGTSFDYNNPKGKLLTSSRSYWSKKGEHIEYYRIYKDDGTRINDLEYKYVGWDKELGLVIAVPHSGGNIVEFFNADGKPRDVANKWNEQSIECVRKNNVISVNSLLFKGEDGKSYYDIYGNKLTYTAPQGEVQYTAFLYYSDPPCVLAVTTDEKAYVCSLDGEVLFETEYPYFFVDEEEDYCYLINAVHGSGDYLCLTDKKENMRVYSISERKELFSFPYALSEYQKMDVYNIPVSIFGEYLLLDGYKKERPSYSLYYIPEKRLVARDLIGFSHQYGYAVFASLTHSTVMSPDGKTVLQFRFDLTD